MNKSLKVIFLTVFAFFGPNSLTFSQKTDTLLKCIEQRKSYIFAQHLEKSHQNNNPKHAFKFIEPKFFLKEELPIFCKMEFLIKQNSQIPVKIRLGDIEYVDMLESKSIPFKQIQ